MKIAVPRELDDGETRAAATPESVTKLTGLGCEVVVERGLGERCRLGDGQYEEAGAKLAGSAAEACEGADAVLRVRKPPREQLDLLRSGVMHVSFLDPFNDPELARELAGRGVTAVSLELMPRTTIAQKMDALSSQHSLSGYYMVILAAERLGRALPMMTTPSGTIQPARVFVIGAGVAGLQAIATAKRLGARVEAFDTRPVVKEQVESLGAKFIEVDLGDTGQTEGGYAKELTDEQRAKQNEAMAKRCALSDVVITTAQLFGRPAPRVIDMKILESMKTGSMVIDYAVSSGGNVEGSVPDQEVEVAGVRVLGLSNFPGRIATDASRMYANNLANFIDTFYDKEASGVKVDLGHEILKGCVVTHGGEIVSEFVKSKIG